MMPRRTATVLFLIVLICLLHFGLRAHRPTHLPLFIDEDRHLRRAANVEDLWTLGLNSHGKYLLYILIAPFNTERSQALWASRVAVALFSLVGLAALYRLTEKLFGRPAAFIAIGFYALAPYALFYERMALADGPAGVLATLTALYSLTFAQRPNYRRATVVGLLVGLAALAKLTMMFIAILPVMAIFLFNQDRPQLPVAKISNLHQMVNILSKQFLANFRYLVVAGVVCIVVWLPVLLPVGTAIVTGQKYVLVDRYLAGDNLLKEGNWDKLVGIWNTFPMLLSPLMVVLILFCVALLVWKAPRRANYVLFWLVLAYLPTILLVGWVQTRYFTPGIFPLAMLLGAGIVATQDIRVPKVSIQPSRLLPALLTVVVVMWGVFYALPFAYDAAYDAPKIELPDRDEKQYYQTRYSAYGLLDAMDYLEAKGKPAGRRVEVMGVMFLCESMDLYTYPKVDLTCLSDGYTNPSINNAWQTLTARAQEEQPLYLIVEDYRDIPTSDSELTWQRLQSIQRPKDGVWVTVWEVCPADNQAGVCGDNVKAPLSTSDADTPQ
ncbi:MAG: glycosyltransferase family 39 protein [Chloroflexi bacterium]|nr:glycosyltransferase family 39 protein [Chloroflexota bacterium]